MIHPKIFLPFAFAISINAGLSNAAGLDGEVKWKRLSENAEIAEKQRWNIKKPSLGARSRGFDFVALRFHLGYYELKIVDIAEFARSNSSKISREQNVDQSLPALFELGVRTVFKNNPFDSPIVAVAPAGFPASSRNPVNLGLLKVNGVEKTKILPNGPSAVLCLHSPQFRDYQYQVPTFYRTNNNSQSGLISRCQDEVQNGPRILEDPNRVSESADVGRVEFYRRTPEDCSKPEPVYLGIPETQENLSAYLRAVFAVDEPCRNAGRGENNAQREFARNAYIIITTTPASFLDLQDMLKSPEFYANERYAPRWAVNLPGDDYAALIYSSSPGSSDAPAKEVGAIDLRQASVLVVTLRR